jgi:hypothetical protein
VGYRIERQAPDRLLLFRDGHLVDEDVEQEEDDRVDIERWGSGVAWAEDYTRIARWDAEPSGDRWHVLLGVAYRYVCSNFEGVTAWDEIAPDGWSSRHIEVGPDGRYAAAAELAAVLTARDIGGAAAVTAYEKIWGVVPEGSFPPDAEPHLTPIDGRAFHDRWIAARNALDPDGRLSP